MILLWLFIILFNSTKFKSSKSPLFIYVVPINKEFLFLHICFFWKPKPTIIFLQLNNVLILRPYIKNWIFNNWIISRHHDFCLYCQITCLFKLVIQKLLFFYNYYLVLINLSTQFWKSGRKLHLKYGVLI